MMGDGTTQRTGSDAWFVTTHWSVVLTAREGNSTRAEDALEVLCTTYWYPLYAFARRQGSQPHDAQDLTQEFFTRLLRKEWLESVAQNKGRFRTFLLVAFKRFLTNEWKRRNTLKRGGGALHHSLDADTAETRYHEEPTTIQDAEQIYERRWALTLLDQTLARLRKEYESTGKGRLFEALKPCLVDLPGEQSSQQMAHAAGLSDGAVRVAVHRLRCRYREIFREEIAQTVAHPEEIEDEIKHLMAILSR